MARPEYPPVVPNVTRRSLLAGVASAVALLPGRLLADEFDGIEEEIARKARALAQGRDILLRIMIPNGSDANVAPVLAEFTKRTGIRTQVEQTHVDDINTRLILNAVSGGTGFDVALPATFGLPDLISAGAVRPLNDFVKRHEPQGFRDDVLYAVGDSFDGETYGFQTDGDTYLMFYNTRLLHDATEQARYFALTGNTLSIPATWQELDRQIAFFHRPEEDIYGGALFRVPGYVAWEWWIRFHGKGALPFSDDMTPQVASEAGRAALQELIDVTKYLIPDAGSVGLFSNWEKFAQGNIYCNIGWGGTQKYLNGPNSKIRDHLAHGPMPGGMLKGKLTAAPYFNWGWTYVVSQQSTEAEIAYLLCLFAASPKMSTLAIGQRDGFFDPIRAEHYDDPTIRNLYGDGFLSVHRDSLQNSIPDLYLANQSEYFLVLNEWIDLALAGEVEPYEALRRVEVEWNLITYRSGRAEQQARWAELVNKYPEALRQP